MRYFLSFARTGSITRAAELHHISAPAFSKAMKVFEAEVGQPLTVAHGRGLMLTDGARVLVPSFEDIIRRIDTIRAEPMTKQALKIASFEVFTTHFLERALAASFLDYHCEVYEMIPGAMEEAVASRRADLALTYLPIPHPELDFLKVLPIEMGIFSTKKTAKFVVPIAPITGSPNKVRGLDGWPDDTFPRDIMYRVGMLETALGLCRRGLACAYIPKFIARLHNETVKPEWQLRELPLPARFPKQKDFVYLIKRKTDREGVEAKKLAAMVRKFC